MTTLRRFTADDLFTLNTINLDPLTENYNITFYLSYLVKWPNYSSIALAPNDQPASPSNRPMGYIMGKAEGRGTDWHGHVTALTVGPTYRRLGIARQLMAFLEDVSDKIYNGYFVDLFVRSSNKLAISMYERLGYITYRQVIGYYSGDRPEDTEDAYDMRKALSRDVAKQSVIPLKNPVFPEDIRF